MTETSRHVKLSVRANISTQQRRRELEASFVCRDVKHP